MKIVVKILKRVLSSSLLQSWVPNASKFLSQKLKEKRIQENIMILLLVKRTIQVELDCSKIGKWCWPIAI